MLITAVTVADTECYGSFMGIELPDSATPNVASSPE